MYVVFFYKFSVTIHAFDEQTDTISTFKIVLGLLRTLNGFRRHDKVIAKLFARIGRFAYHVLHKRIFLETFISKLKSILRKIDGTWSIERRQEGADRQRSLKRQH